MKSLRPEELQSAEKLKHFIISQGYEVNYEPGEDPPDIVMKVGDEKWSVEHTSLHEYVEADGDELSRVGWGEMVLELGQRVLRATEGKRKAGWSLTVFGPFGKNVLNEIEKAAVEAIATDDPDYFSRQIYPDREYLNSTLKDITLTRYEDDSRGFVISQGFRSLSLLPEQRGLVANVQARTDYAVNRILKNKTSKLVDIKGYDKLVLLIENRDFLIEAIFVENSLRNKSDFASFFNLIFFDDGDKITKVFGTN